MAVSITSEPISIYSKHCLEVLDPLDIKLNNNSFRGIIRLAVSMKSEPIYVLIKKKYEHTVYRLGPSRESGQNETTSLRKY